MTNRLRFLVQAAPLAALLVGLPCHALYKVVGPDGRVTYTDRPPAAAAGNRVSSLGAGGNAVSEAQLPLELRQPAARYPVTLYTMSNCNPCDTARQLLRQRGIPFAEKQVTTREDADALQRLSGDTQAPTLSIGSQVLRGLSPEAWNSYLDSAGYPRESRLPAGYQYPPAAPLIERRDVGAGQPVQPVVPQATLPAPAAQPEPSVIKF
ncbi:glutaredoxin family protein [Piscinibacter sp.]|jgi:glutaredoxin|uniref:glutaredoxin family protein n=1 Tax=Piscinibacter sp. TaxID=1903157 RepID=UPI002F410E13